MESAEIRRRWLSFFEARGHTVVPSAWKAYVVTPSSGEIWCMKSR